MASKKPCKKVTVKVKNGSNDTKKKSAVAYYIKKKKK